jgi:hypothetical protein
MSLPSGLDGDAANFGFGPGEALGSESVWPALSGLVCKGIFAYYFVKVTINASATLKAHGMFRSGTGCNNGESPSST